MNKPIEFDVITAHQHARHYSLEELRIIDMFLHSRGIIALDKIYERNINQNQPKPFVSESRNQNYCKQAKIICQTDFCIVTGRGNDDMEEDKISFNNSRIGGSRPTSSSNPL